MSENEKKQDELLETETTVKQENTEVEQAVSPTEQENHEPVAPATEAKNEWVVSDAPRKESTETTVPAPSVPSGNQPYLYRWSYADQRAFDQRQDQRKKKRGAAIYAAIMATVFAACFVVLIGTLIWYQIGGGVGGGSVNAVAVSREVAPATVLIYSSGETSYGYGTGFFIRSNGYIATNYHVVENADSISVSLYSGETYSATLVGYSKNDDVAVLKIPGERYPTVSIGNSGALQVGQAAIVVGNPSGIDGAWTTTQGIISALDRPVGVESSVHEGVSIGAILMIQTDAAVNPGNSGGPLCNADGEVIGIITRKYVGTDTTFEAMGYALPINNAMPLLNAIIENGSIEGVTSTLFVPRPVLGITVQDVKSGEKYPISSTKYNFAPVDGVLVTSVTRNLPAYGYLREYDIIYEIEGVTVTNQVEFTQALYSHNVGDTITFKLMRGNTELEKTFTLSEVE